MLANGSVKAIEAGKGIFVKNSAFMGLIDTHSRPAQLAEISEKKN
jgi:hypothetical protein